MNRLDKQTDEPMPETINVDAAWTRQLEVRRSLEAATTSVDEAMATTIDALRFYCSAKEQSIAGPELDFGSIAHLMALLEQAVELGE
jgi:hypothetical protein